MTDSYALLETNASLMARSHSASNCAWIEINMLFSNAPLVKPQFLQVLLHAKQLGILMVPLVDVYSD